MGGRAMTAKAARHMEDVDRGAIFFACRNEVQRLTK
jgi:hypothetical protein